MMAYLVFVSLEVEKTKQFPKKNEACITALKIKV